MSGRRKVLATALEITVPILILLIWGVWSANAGSFYFPPLTDVLGKFNDLWLFERVGSDVVPSVVRLTIGYTIAVTFAIAVGIPLGMYRTARQAAAPIVEFLRAVPPPTLIPFGLVVIGVGDVMKVFVITFVCIWPVLLNTIAGITGLDPTLKDTARMYGITGVERLRRVVLPAAAPQIFAGMRTSLALALILMVISEMFASTNGLGFFVLQSQRSFAVPEMWSGILLLGLLGYSLNALFVLAERRILAWHRAAKASALS
jgi:ABC-type nitrate/sulfonate/bicarbonate transport system permease component